MLFDMDGTVYDSGIDFLAIRERIGLRRDGTPILEQLRTASPDVRDRGIELLHAAEAEGAARGRLIPGAVELITWLRGCGVRCGLITNNSRRSVEAVFERHPLTFDVVLTRDDGAAKPEPDLFHRALEQLSGRPECTAAIGDTHLDALAAHRAGIRDMFLISLDTWMADLIPPEVSYTRVDDLYDLRNKLDVWICRMDGAPQTEDPFFP
jgi:HAD superfamily hydrolase (TIGR01549 family)